MHGPAHLETALAQEQGAAMLLARFGQLFDQLHQAVPASMHIDSYMPKIPSAH